MTVRINKKQIVQFSLLASMLLCALFVYEPSNSNAAPLPQGPEYSISGWAWGEGFVDWTDGPGGTEEEMGGQGLRDVKHFLARTLMPVNVALAWDDFPGVDDANDKAGGMGWLSFNCNDAGNCDIPYGVDLDQTTGEMTGFAWSDNYGWIQFGAGCPNVTNAPNGEYYCDSRLDFTMNRLVGFAKVLSGDDCPKAGVCADDSFDGWISLYDGNDQYPDNVLYAPPAGIAYGIVFDPTVDSLTGYAWGDGGWISFESVYVDEDVLGGGKVNLVPTASLAEAQASYGLNGLSNDETVAVGPIVLSWNSPTSANITSCTPTSIPANTEWNATDFSATSTNIPPAFPAFTYKENIILPVAEGIYTFKLDCLLQNGSTVSSTATVTVDTDFTPPLSLYKAGTTSDSDTVYPPQYLADVSYKSDTPNFNQNIACKGVKTNSSGTANYGDWDTDDEEVPTVAGAYYTEYGISVPDDPTFFKIECTSTSGMTVSSNVLKVSRIEPGEPNVGLIGSCSVAGSVTENDTPYVEWNVKDASTCVVTGTNFSNSDINLNDGADIGSKDVSSLAPSTSSYSYSLECENESGSDYADAKVWYLPSTESCSLACDPATDPWCTTSGIVIPKYDEQKYKDTGIPDGSEETGEGQL